MSQKKKNSHKKLYVTLGLLFGLAGIGTAAFAGYVLSDSKVNFDDNTVTPGQITIENKNYSLNVTLEDASLLFYPAAAVDTGRLQYDGGPAANLDLVLTLTPDDPDHNLNEKTININIETSGDNNAVTKNYITAPGNTTATITDNAETAVTLTWGWGDAFGGSDPCEYFNNGAGKELPLGKSDDINTTTVNGVLNDFNTALKATTFTITVTVGE